VQAVRPSSEKVWYQLMKAVLETTHLLLRPWQEEDLDPLVRLLARPEVARFLRLDGRTFTREETAQVHQTSLRWTMNWIPPAGGEG
jgi:RimJ/RimL family protein N-acetyltransferase